MTNDERKHVQTAIPQLRATKGSLLERVDNLMILACVLAVAGGAFQIRHTFPDLFRFQPNGYALLSLVAILVSLAAMYVLLKRSGNIQARTWLAIQLLGSTVWALGEMLTRLSMTAPQALFWSDLSIIGIALTPIGFYMFSRYYVDQTSRRRDVLLPMVLLFTSGIMVAFLMHDETLASILTSHGPWGYSVPVTPYLYVLTLWITALFSLGVVRFIQQRRSNKRSNIRAQSAIIVGSVAVSFIGTVITDIILPSIGYDILSMGALLQTVTAGGIVYAIYRYDTFAIDFETVAAEILDTLAEAVIVTDNNFVIRSANRKGLEMSGYNDEELYAAPVKILFGSAFSVYKSSIQGQLVAKSVAHINEGELHTKDGTTTAVTMAVAKLEGTYPAYLFALNDISQIKEFYGREAARAKELELAVTAYRNEQQAMANLLEDARDLELQLKREKAGVEKKVELGTAEVRAERARLEASINSLNVGFFMVDQHQQVITLNAAVRKILNNEALGKQPHLQEIAQTLEGSYDLKGAIASCFATRHELSVDSLQFGEKVLRIFVAPIHDELTAATLLGAVVLLEDITEAKAAERSRDEFFSIASHELRTPLTAIRGNTKMMQDYYGAQFTDPSLKEMLEDIHESSVRLITIVNDFLNTSRLEQGKIEFKITEFSAPDLVAEVIKEFKAGDFNNELYLNIALPENPLPLVRADYDRLKETLINLIGNGFKFTEKGGLTIQFDHTEAVVMIRVSDTGKGVPLESQSLLFRKFQQASNNILTRDSTRSTGLGLYISKLMITGMGGTVYLESSEVNKGSTFTVEVPIAGAGEEVQKEATAETTVKLL